MVAVLVDVVGVVGGSIWSCLRSGGGGVVVVFEITHKMTLPIGPKYIIHTI